MFVTVMILPDDDGESRLSFHPDALSIGQAVAAALDGTASTVGLPDAFTVRVETAPDVTPHVPDAFDPY